MPGKYRIPIGGAVSVAEIPGFELSYSRSSLKRYSLDYKTSSGGCGSHGIRFREANMIAESCKFKDGDAFHKFIISGGDANGIVVVYAGWQLGR